MSGEPEGRSGDTYNRFSGNAQVVIQARTIAGGVQVHVDRELPPISTRAFAVWLLVAAVPLTAGVVLGRFGAAHVHDVGGLVALGAAVLVGLLAVRIAVVAWEWWVLSREQEADILDRRLDRAVRMLARTLSEQWRAEERLPRHRLQDPHPLPVRWTNEVADTQPDLAATFEDIVDTFDTVPSRRLVVLGSAGSGKSVLARRFALNWLTRELGAADTRPIRVPVILPLASWNPEESLIGWAAARLANEHPALGRRMLSGGTVAETLLRGGRLLPVLDGFDEIAGPLGGEAMRRLNQAFDQDVPVLLTSRPEQYRDAVDDVGVVFSAAAVVTLCPLDAAAVRDYLLTSTNRTVRVGDQLVPKWQPVLDRLAAERADPAADAVREALSTPLMVVLARAAYSDTRADPAELLDADRFADRAGVEQHLLDRLVPSAYDSPDEPGGRPHWSAGDAARWLGFLARRMNAEGTQELAWWRLAGRETRYAAAATVVVLVGALAATMATLDHPATGLPLWVAYLLLVSVPVTEAAVLAVATDTPAPTAIALRPGRVRGLLLRSLLCVAVGLPLWALLHVNAILLALAACVVLVRGVRSTPLDLSVVTDPPGSLRSDRRATVLLGLWYAVTGGARRWRAAAVLLAPLAVFWLWSVSGGAGTDLTGQWWLVVVVTVVVLFGYGLLASAWGQFQLIRGVLTARGELPWRVLGFLADAHRRGVLRRTGGVYQFRHARLQDRLAGTAQRADDTPIPARRAARVPARLSLAIILVGAVVLVGMTTAAPGAPGPYLGFAPVCDELQRELVPFLSADAQVQATESATDFTCLVTDEPNGPFINVDGYLDTATTGASALANARGPFTERAATEPHRPPTAASCGEPVITAAQDDVDMLCGNADVSVAYSEAGVDSARLTTTAATLAEVAIGIALGDRAPVADDAHARRTAIRALAARPRPLAPTSGSARYRPGPEQVVTGPVWQPTDATALQDVGAFVFRTPATLWCGPRTPGGSAPSWNCATASTSQAQGGYLTLDLAIRKCPGTCTPAQRTQVEQAWESSIQQQYDVDLTGVTWRLSDPQTAYAESLDFGIDQLLMVYLTRSRDGTVSMIAAAARADFDEIAAARKTVNDIRTQAALSALAQ